MVKQPLNLTVKGHLKLTKVTNGVSEVVYDDHNDLDVNYKNIIRHCIAGDATYFIDKMEVFKAASSLAVTNISNIEYIPLTDNEVKFVAIFDETSFNDTFDEILLKSDGGGPFSHVDSLSISKDDQTQLIVSWTLKIINQP